ncbi:TetR/AcrR family transcriptional regulator [Actinoallomurus iriomotensis]|uniref:TetR family transcriptional regulator n=1 Tax=Actinoallomurus iriomotensis TaxID=478107 RepID=A0A9W6S3M6_9ACTN|nr:TetR/AcrR family transcriptional regulator [Actinoallomurus iriomotensis]GLY86626.1 TetR family transcriptional regulator [Actinoallomurus iriomotensis]
MAAIRNARERARSALVDDIKAEAFRQLSEHGSTGLTIRAIARELGMVPSALYRYFPSREQLLTAMIIDSYSALADHLDAAAATQELHRDRWLAVCHGVRDWAFARPHQYALLYGTAVPGYQAPQDTIAPAVRIPLLLLGIACDAWRAGQLTQPADEPWSDEVAANATTLARATGFLDVPPSMLMRAVSAYTQLFGAVSMELFGHLNSAFDNDTVFFNHSITLLADLVGFRCSGSS